MIDKFGGHPQQGFFGVYDGHGGRGAVELIQNKLHEVFLQELENTDDVDEAWKAAFLKTDDLLEESKILYSGATVVAAFIHEKGGHKTLYTANVGDARAVLCRSDKALRLTYDHKASDEQEQKRIVDAGGFIVLNRVNGVLAVTRALGDRAMKDFVINDPFCSKVPLKDSDTLLILACDGIWDVISDQEAIDLIKDETSAQKMSDKLLTTALKNGSTDNVSVVVIKL